MSRRMPECTAALVAFGVFLGACGGDSAASPSPTPDSSVIARVGSQSITQEQFDIRLTSARAQLIQAGGPSAAAPGSAMEKEIRARVLGGLVSDAVIAQEAEFRHVAATDAEVAAEVGQDEELAGGVPELEQQLSDVGGSLAQLRDEIRSRINEQRLEDLFAKERADGVLTRAVSGETFAALARGVSDDTQSASKGGDLGVVSAAQLDAGDAGFKAAVLSLRAGQTTAAPVRDAAGYEILRVLAVTPHGRHVLRILVAAPQPYTVKERPHWFAASVYQALQALCTQGRVVVYAAADLQPCAVASPSATP